MILINGLKKSLIWLGKKLEMFGMDVATDILSRFRVRKNIKKLPRENFFNLQSKSR